MLVQQLKIVLVWATLSAVSAQADNLLTDEQLLAGWEGSHLQAAKASLLEISSHPENQNYDALSLERRIVGKYAPPRAERYYRKCALVRQIDGVTWIRYFSEFRLPDGNLVQGQKEWIIEGDRILLVSRAGASTTARFQTAPRGDLWTQFFLLKGETMLPHRIRSVNWTMQRPDIRYRIDENGDSRAEVGMSRPRLRPGDSAADPPMPGGDIRVLFSPEAPHLPTFLRRLKVLGEEERSENSLGVQFFYDRSPEKPTFLNRVVEQAIVQDGEFGTISCDTRFERVNSDSQIPRIKIAETMHIWQVEKERKWTTIPVEEVPQEFIDRIEVVSDYQSGKRYGEFPNEIRPVRDRLEAQRVPPLSELPLADGELVEPEPAHPLAAAPHTLDLSLRRSLFLAAGIVMLIAGVVLFGVFVTARLAKANATPEFK